MNTCIRYNFIAHEKFCHQLWAKECFFNKDDFVSVYDALLFDIQQRIQQALTTCLSPSLLPLGILVNSTSIIIPTETIQSYGADACRINLLIHKKIQSEPLPQWRWIQRLHTLFYPVIQNPKWDKDVITKELQNYPEFYTILFPYQQHKYYQVLALLKSFLKSHKTISFNMLCFVASLLAPFIPHLFCDFLSFSKQSYALIMDLSQHPITVQSNGRFIDIFYTSSTDVYQIQKEALSLPKIQRRIKGREVRFIFIPQGVLNVIF